MAALLLHLNDSMRGRLRELGRCSRLQCRLQLTSAANRVMRGRQKQWAPKRPVMELPGLSLTASRRRHQLVNGKYGARNQTAPIMIKNAAGKTIRIRRLTAVGFRTHGRLALETGIRFLRSIRRH